MKTVRLIIGAGLMIAAFMATSVVSFATPEMGKKEKKPCTTCHVTAKSKDLNNVGQYYKQKKSLEGAPAPEKK